jgi:hypothetical protein
MGICTMPALSTRYSTREACLISLHHLGGVGRDRARFGVGHARFQHATDTADDGHHVLPRDDEVEVLPALPALLDLFDDVLCADHVRACFARGVCLLALGEHEHFLLFARAVRQVHHAAHHLVALARVDAQVHRHIDRLIELGGGGLLHLANRLNRRVGLLSVAKRLDRLHVAFAVALFLLDCASSHSCLLWS